MSNLDEVNKTLHEANLLSNKIKGFSAKLKDMPDDERQKMLNAIKQHMKSSAAKYSYTNYVTFFCVSILVFVFGTI